MVPSPQKIVDAMAERNISFACRGCSNEADFKIQVAGLNHTELGASATNTSTTTARWTPMAFFTCGKCGETRFYHLEWLGFRPPY